MYDTLFDILSLIVDIGMAFSSADIVTIVQALAWPTALVWAAWYFRDVFPTLAGRIKKIGPTGVELGDALPAQVPSTPEDVASKSAGTGPATSTAAAIAHVKGRFSDDVLNPVIEEGRRDLPRFAPSTEDKIEFLLVATSVFSIQLAYERVYINIFGSQLALLQKLNSVPFSIEAARVEYGVAAAKFEPLYAKIPFEAWMSFLTASNLVVLTADSSYVITHNGRAFLRYLIDQARWMEKPG